jgi:hypothetical protein
VTITKHEESTAVKNSGSIAPMLLMMCGDRDAILTKLTMSECMIILTGAIARIKPPSMNAGCNVKSKNGGGKHVNKKNNAIGKNRKPFKRRICKKSTRKLRLRNDEQSEE